MPDISMCTDRACPSRASCYRYVAVPSEWQTYSDFRHEGTACEYFFSPPDGAETRYAPDVDAEARG